MPTSHGKESLEEMLASSSSAKRQGEDAFIGAAHEESDHDSALDFAGDVLDAPKKRRSFGLRGKMFFLFFVVPVFIFFVSGIYSWHQLGTLSSTITTESSSALKGLSVQMIQQRAEDVANEVALYIETHPYMTPKDLGRDEEFKEHAVQKVGEGGFTVVDIEPEKDSDPWIGLIGPIPDISGGDVASLIKADIGEENYKIFKGIMKRAHETGKATGGFYGDGTMYQFMAPVRGTRYWVFAVNDTEIFAKPLRELNVRSGKDTANVQHLVLWIFGVTVVLFACITLIYGNILSHKIKTLTNVADRISMGDMDVEIVNKDKDELGDLTDAIIRMQDSIRISLQRLRKRR